ncbi:hypothetical protein L7F22_012776 [Adiantum nelumboides]|nr:hypothetical protein [Adiantum nelumboides]
MSKNMQEEERLIDFSTLDLYIDVDSPDATCAVEFLACKLQEAMENPALQDAGIVIIIIYVDDLIIGGDYLEDVEHVKALLRKQFDMKDLGELGYFLGIEMIRNEGGVWLLQKKYGLDMLMKYGMADCKPISTPLDQNLKLRIDEGEVLML